MSISPVVMEGGLAERNVEFISFPTDDCGFLLRAKQFFGCTVPIFLFFEYTAATERSSLVNVTEEGCGFATSTSGAKIPIQ